MTSLHSASNLQKMAKESRWLATIEWTLAGAAAAFQLFIAPHEIWGDGYIRFNTLVQLVDKGDVSASRYSMMHSFLSAPLYALGKVFHHGSEFASYFNVLLFHLTLILLYRMLRRHVPTPILRRTILLLLAASMFGNNVQTYYGEVLTACFAMLGVSALAINRPIIAGIALCISVINTPIALVALVLCNGWWALRTRRWFQAAWPVVVSVALIALEFWWRRGSPTRSGYEGDSGYKSFMPYSGHPGFSYPLPLGLLSLLFSFGKGILFFAPGLLLYYLATPSKRDPVASMLGQLAMAFFWGMVLGHSPWWCWYGAWCWGPRFLLVACFPASFALAQHVSNLEYRHAGLTLLTVSAIIWSVWVGINGTVIREVEYDVCTANGFNFEAICWYVPEFSPLIHPFIKPKTLATWDKVYVLLGASVAAVLILPMLASRIRHFAVHALARSP